MDSGIGRTVEELKLAAHEVFSNKKKKAFKKL